MQKIATDYRCKGMPLSSFLLKPMQRITRYPLIIKNVSLLLYHSDSIESLLLRFFFNVVNVPADSPLAAWQVLESTPETHMDHSHLHEALEKAEELCLQVNEGVREKENSDRLEWIQAHVQREGVIEVTVLSVLGYPNFDWRSSPKFSLNNFLICDCGTGAMVTSNLGYKIPENPYINMHSHLLKYHNKTFTHRIWPSTPWRIAWVLVNFCTAGSCARPRATRSCMCSSSMTSFCLPNSSSSFLHLGGRDCSAPSLMHSSRYTRRWMTLLPHPNTASLTYFM